MGLSAVILAGIVQTIIRYMIMQVGYNLLLRAFFRRGISRACGDEAGAGGDHGEEEGERERQMRENNENDSETAHEHVEGDSLGSPEEKMNEDIIRNSPAEVILTGITNNKDKYMSEC